ncbi:MAG: TRAP transporter substrate-binding protein [Thermodesulforhabdaceae bacterium]
MKWTTFLKAFACLASVVLFATASYAREEIKLGVVTKPGSAQNVCAEKFKELLESKSNKYTVTIYHSASLGTETEILQQVQLGSVHMAIITSGPFDVFVPEVRVVDYPFLFESYEQVDAVLDGPPGQEILKRLEKAGFKGLAFSENGFRHLTNSKRPVHSVKDVEGLKIRVMESVIHKELWRLLGANPTPMGWPIYTELQQGTIDGQENPLSVIWNYKLYEVQKYLSLTKHVYSSHIDIASLKWFQSLPPEDQKLIRETMIEAAHYQRKWNRENEATFLKNLKEAGMIVDENPDIQSFREKAKEIRNLNIFQVKEVQEVLPLFLKQ